jgi:hypothetical protein
MKGRLYDPDAGRFLTADPIVQAPFWSQGLNRYAYVFNSPLNYVDPSGFSAIDQYFEGSEDWDTGQQITGYGGPIVATGLAAYAAYSIVSSASASASASVSAAGASAAGSSAGSSGFGANPANAAGGAGASTIITLWNAFKPAIRFTPQTPSAAPTAAGDARYAHNAVGENRGGVYNQVRSPPTGPDRRLACYPECLPNPNDAFPDTPAGRAMKREYYRGYQAVGDILTLVGGAVRSMAARAAARIAARAGVPLARAIETGLVKEGGKLAQVLGGIEKGYAAAGPKNALDALGLVKRATSAVGLEPGVATVGKAGEIVLQNVGGVTTTLGTNGSILVQRGSDVLLHLVP